jgi:hypothetical protein
LAANDKDIAGLFNKPGHGCSIECVADALISLLNRKLISVWRNEEPLILKRSEIHAELQQHSDDEMYFGLTSAGGAVWERFARPDWSKFILIAQPDDSHRELRSLDRQVLIYYIREFMIHFGIKVEWETMSWSEIQNWSATYWKTLEAGYAVTFRFNRIFKDEEVDFDKFPGGFYIFQRSWYRWD